MRRAQCGQALIILAFLIYGGSGVTVGQFLTGKSTKELKKEAQAMVKDSGRQEKIEAAFRRWEKDLEPIEKEREKSRKAVLSLIQKHDATAADFERLLAQADAIQARMIDATLDVRFDLREQLTPDEWRKLFSAN